MSKLETKTRSVANQTDLTNATTEIVPRPVRCVVTRSGRVNAGFLATFQHSALCALEEVRLAT